MALTPDRQGYLGNIETKTLPQLQELLERQEKLLSQKRLVESLSDKGDRVRRFAEKLRQIIQAHTSGELGSQLFSARTSKPLLREIQEKDNADFDINEIATFDKTKTIDALLNRDEENVIVIQQDDSGTEKSERSHISNDVGELSSNLQALEIGSKMKNVHEFSNSYERVIKKAGESQEEARPKYCPFRSLKYTVENSPSLHHEENQKRKAKQKVEESAVNPPPYKHQAAKLISIEESVTLIQVQRKRNENLVAERAAQRLADQLGGPKMDSYLPANPDMLYRETKTNDAEEKYDSDDIPSDTEKDDVD